MARQIGNWRKVLAISSTVTVLFSARAVWAANLTNDSIVKQIKSEKVFTQNVPINSIIQSPTVILEVFLVPSLLSKDLKIDAVLLAKAVMDLDPKIVSRVVVKFIDKSTCKEVAVTAGDIKSYALGAISTDQLLSSIEIEEKSAAGDKSASRQESIKLSDHEPTKNAQDLSNSFIEPSAESEIFQDAKFGLLLFLASNFARMEKVVTALVPALQFLTRLIS